MGQLGTVQPGWGLADVMKQTWLQRARGFVPGKSSAAALGPDS